MSEISKSRLENEKVFHDAWADSTDVATIDVLESNEICTAPEMRWITERLGPLAGRTLLDVGCGLGEASVYFALKGASVTSTDLSPGMLQATQKLAAYNGTGIKTHLANAESMQLSSDARFDIIYVGNLFHHVDIEPTLKKLVPHLNDGGTLVSWDPLAYNPAINVYRAIATEVRTPDEHPLKMADIRLFKKYFGDVETRYFWFFTLIIFAIMAVVQGQNPNKVRYWKKVVEDGHRWEFLYTRLETLDRWVLKCLPFLKPLCWNVAICATRPNRNLA